MTHLYIELNTGLTEEVNSSIISKLYELAISGDLDNTSDLKGRLHSSTAKEKHVTYLNNNFDELYISADTQYLSFDDPDVETLMKRYIGTDDGVSLLDVQTFVNSGTAFGDGYINAHTNRNGSFGTNNEEKALINSFDEINLFNGITSIATHAFSSSGLISIQLPSSITTLGTSSFGSCPSLTTITGLSNVTSLGNGCFYNCSNLSLTDLNFANLTSLKSLTFYNCTSYPFGNLSLPSVTTIEKEAFRQCTGITKLTLNDNVTVSSDNTFWHCTNMTLADLGSGIMLTNNSHSMFTGCTSLTTVTGMSDVTIIPKYMFADCTSLTSVDIDWSKITSIGTGALSKCPIGTGLTIELNLTNQSSHFGGALERTKFDKIIVHCNWSGNGDANHPPFNNLPYTTYIDASDCMLHPANGYSLSTVNGDNSLVTVIYPPSVNQIRCGPLGFTNALGTFRYMIILNTTPPDINVDYNHPFSSQFPSNSILHIYVPDSAVSDYLADSKWSQLGGNNGTVTILLRLHGLSELPAGVWTTGLASQYLTPAQLITT